MAGPIVFPFDGYLPRQDSVADLVAPPYDSVPVEDSHRPVAGNPLSFLNVVRSEVDHPEQTAAERKALLDATHDRLMGILRSGAYRYHPAPLYLVCRLEQGGHRQTGVVADVSLAAYDRGDVRVHESTVRGQEDRLVEYMSAVPASFLPVFLIHRAAPAVDAAVDMLVRRPPDVDVATDDGLRMSLWAITQEAAVAELEDALGAVDRLYVADGHHRLAAASRYAAATGGPADAAHRRIVSVLFPADQLVIHNYNRCVTDLGGLTAEELVAAAAGRFDVERIAAAPEPTSGSGELAMLVDGAWYRLGPGPATRPAVGVDALDVSILQHRLLGPILGIDDPRDDPRLEFVPGTLGLGELERLCADGYAAGFAVPPPSVDELFAVSDRGELMPPKSTWFAPKLRSGMVVRLL